MLPNLVFSDKEGNIYVHPELKMLGLDGRGFCLPSKQELIALPKGSSLFYMPGHIASGWDEAGEGAFQIEEFAGKKVFPVSAFLIPGFTRLYLPASEKKDKKIILPLWPYTAVGWMKGKFYASAVKIDNSRKQLPRYYQDMKAIKKGISDFLKKFPKNRLVKHLSKCALEYNCRNAQNLFLKRWEAPLPVSPGCNAKCLGCISYQDSDCVEASHSRISFVPSPCEVAEVAVAHLKYGRQPMVSFGQGCEGEPLLQFSVIKESIELIRKQALRGIIHLNTNGFNSIYLKELAQVGLNSVRISVNSFNAQRYAQYYRPLGYCLDDVLESIKQAKKSGLFVSLNFLVMPGFSDREDELAALVKFLKKGYVNLVQLRNLSIDPEFFYSKMPRFESKSAGILNMITILKKSFPNVGLGYFNPNAIEKGVFLC